MKDLRIVAATLTAVAILITVAGSALAAAPSAAPGHNKILCFASGAASCTQSNSSAKGSATLSVTGAGTAALYYAGYNDSIYGVTLPMVKDLSFFYAGAPTAGSPRFSVPIDQNNDGLTEAFAFVPAITCNNGNGKVDVIGDSTCLVYYAPDGVAGYPNWAAFAAAHPTYEVSLTDNYVFVVSDDIGSWTLDTVIIGKPGR